MKKNILMSVSFLLFAVTMMAQELFVGSYNIRYKNQWDTKAGNSWE